MSLPLLLLLVDHRGCGVPRVRFAVPDKTAENADHESLDAATECPCCVMPCDVFFVAAVDATASDFSFVRRRKHRCGKKVRSRTQLDGTVLAVVAVIAWCCVLLVAGVLLFL